MTPASDPMGGTTIHDPTSERVEAVAAALAKAEGLDWSEVCAVEADPTDAGAYCDSSTCVAAHHEDHDPDAARAYYRRLARVAIAASASTQPASLLEGERERWAKYVEQSMPLIEAIAAWERDNGRLAAIMPTEYDAFCRRLAHAAIRGSARAALSPPAEAGQGREIPEGYVAVPREPTAAMIAAGSAAIEDTDQEDVDENDVRFWGQPWRPCTEAAWRAMLDATPDTLPKGDVADRDAIRAKAMEEAARVADIHAKARLAARQNALDRKRPREARDHESMSMEATLIAAAIRQRIVSAREEG